MDGVTAGESMRTCKLPVLTYMVAFEFTVVKRCCIA